MNPSFLRMSAPLEDAMDRYGRWIGTLEVESARLVNDREALDLALEDATSDVSDWRGLAVYVYADGDATVFQELSGGLAGQPAEKWVRLADGGDLVYAGYNDAIAYGELVVVTDGRLVRHFLQDEDDPSVDINVGKLPDEDGKPIKTWTDVAFWAESHEDQLFPGAEKGWLWIHQVTW